MSYPTLGGSMLRSTPTFGHVFNMYNKRRQVHLFNANMSYTIVCLPLRLLRSNTDRPVLVLFLLRNPNLRFRRNVLGWYCRFTNKMAWSSIAPAPARSPVVVGAHAPRPHMEPKPVPRNAAAIMVLRGACRESQVHPVLEGPEAGGARGLRWGVCSGEKIPCRGGEGRPCLETEGQAAGGEGEHRGKGCNVVRGVVRVGRSSIGLYLLFPSKVRQGIDPKLLKISGICVRRRCSCSCTSKIDLERSAYCF